MSFCRTPRVFCEMLSAMFIRYFWDEGFGTTVLVPVSFREIGSWKVFHFIAWQEVLWINMKRDEVEPKSPRAFQNIDEAGVKFLVEKKS